MANETNNLGERRRPAGALLWARPRTGSDQAQLRRDEAALDEQKRRIQEYANQAGLLIVTPITGVVSTPGNMLQHLRSLPVLLQRMHPIDALIVCRSTLQGIHGMELITLHFLLQLQGIELIACD